MSFSEFDMSCQTRKKNFLKQIDQPDIDRKNNRSVLLTDSDVTGHPTYPGCCCSKCCWYAYGTVV